MVKTDSDGGDDNDWDGWINKYRFWWLMLFVLQMGSDVYLCYKKSMAKANLLAFKPCMYFNFCVSDIEK